MDEPVACGVNGCNLRAQVATITRKTRSQEITLQAWYHLPDAPAKATKLCRKHAAETLVELTTILTYADEGMPT